MAVSVLDWERSLGKGVFDTKNTRHEKKRSSTQKKSANELNKRGTIDYFIIKPKYSEIDEKETETGISNTEFKKIVALWAKNNLVSKNF